MSWIARLRYNNSTLNLYDSTYRVASSFSPPQIAMVSNIASGTSVNRFDGGSLAGVSFRDRSWIVPLHVGGSSESAVTANIEKINSFIQAALENKTGTLYFEFKLDDTIDIIPSWGQSAAPRRVQVKSGYVNPGRQYSSINQAGELPNCELTMIIAPVVEGIEQLAASGTGGLALFRAGANDKTRGLIIHPAATNKFTNPIFGAADWDSGWTTGAGITSSVCTNPEYVFYGAKSAHLVGNGSAAGFYQSINVGSTSDHYLSFMVKKLDSQPVTESDVEVYYNSIIYDPTILPMPNGWYLVYSPVVGVASSVPAGAIVYYKASIYLDAFQLEEASSPSWACHGDMLDVAWTGTPHNSTSTRTAGRVFLTPSDVMDTSEGTIAVTWLPFVNSNNTPYSTSVVELFDDSASTGFRGTYAGTASCYRMGDGTNTLSSGSVSFTAGVPEHLWFTWGGAGMAIYRNGTSIASGTAYAFPTLGGTIAIGSSTATTNHMRGAFLGFTIYPRRMTATQVAEHYAQISPISANLEMVDAIPVMWTDDGDDTIDNCLDSTRENYLAYINVPGTSRAITEYKIRVDTTAQTFDADQALWLGVTPLNEYNRLALEVFEDLSGSSVASACGGAVENVSVSTTAVELGGMYPSYAGVYMPEMFGRDYYMLTRLADAGGTLSIAARVYNGMSLGVVNSYDYDWRAVTGGTAYKLYAVGPIRMPAQGAAAPDWLNAVAVTPIFKRGSGTATVSVDYVSLLPGDFVKIVQPSTTGSVLSGKWVRLKNRSAYMETEQNGLENYFIRNASVVGNSVDLYPGVYNLMWGYRGDDSVTNTITSSTLYFDWTKITPRWTIL